MAKDAQTAANIRLLDPGVVTETYQQLQAERPFYRLNDLDVDRYEINGETTQVVRWGWTNARVGSGCTVNTLRCAAIREVMCGGR